jgi:hypothetical protein
MPGTRFFCSISTFGDRCQLITGADKPAFPDRFPRFILWATMGGGDTTTNYFKSLNIEFLKNYSGRWIDCFQHVQIDKITLHLFNPDPLLAQFRNQLLHIPTKYTVLFHVAVDGTDGQKEHYNQFASDLSFFSPINNFLLRNNRNKPLETIPAIGMDAAFPEAYKNQAPDDFLKEWHFSATVFGESLPPAASGAWTDGPHVVLFDRINKARDEKTLIPNGCNSATHNHYARESANKRWGPYKEVLCKAIETAKEKWGKGEPAFHNEMADYLIGRPEFKQLKGTRSALIKKLKPVAEKFGRVRGKAGSFKDK